MAFSPDGRSILTGSRDGMARLWDGEIGQPVGRPLDYGSQVSAVAFSRDGKTIVAGGRDGKVRLWDVASGHHLGQPVELGSRITAVALSPDGKTILTGSSDKTARSVGRRHRPATRSTHAAFGLCGLRGVQPGRQDDPHRER